MLLVSFLFIVSYVLKCKKVFPNLVSPIHGDHLFSATISHCCANFLENILSRLYTKHSLTVVLKHFINFRFITWIESVLGGIWHWAWIIYSLFNCLVAYYKTVRRTQPNICHYHLTKYIVPTDFEIIGELIHHWAQGLRHNILWQILTW